MLKQPGQAGTMTAWMEMKDQLKTPFNYCLQIKINISILNLYSVNKSNKTLLSLTKFTKKSNILS